MVDHNLSFALARCLQSLFPDHETIAKTDRFANNTDDVDWITALSEEKGWAVLTKDLGIQTRPHERLALDRSSIVFFFIGRGWRKFSVPETAVRLIRLFPLMVQQRAIVERGRFDLPINAGSKLRPHRT